MSGADVEETPKKEQKIRQICDRCQTKRAKVKVTLSDKSTSLLCRDCYADAELTIVKDEQQTPSTATVKEEETLQKEQTSQQPTNQQATNSSLSSPQSVRKTTITNGTRRFFDNSVFFLLSKSIV
jgi:protein-arginine kinase activator protein McsA